MMMMKGNRNPTTTTTTPHPTGRHSNENPRDNNNDDDVGRRHRSNSSDSEHPDSSSSSSFDDDDDDYSSSNNFSDDISSDGDSSGISHDTDETTSPTTTTTTTRRRTRSQGATTTTTTTTLQHSLTPPYNNDNNSNIHHSNIRDDDPDRDENDSDEDSEVDPIIEAGPHHSSTNRTITSSILAVANVVLRQRRPVGLVGQPKPSTTAAATTTAATTRRKNNGDTNETYRTATTSNQYRYRSHHQTTHARSNSNEHRTISATKRHRTSDTRRQNNCGGCFARSNHAIIPEDHRSQFERSTSCCNHHKKGKSAKTYRTKTKRGRRTYDDTNTTTMVNTMATYLLGSCFLIWLVVLGWNWMWDPTAVVTSSTTMFQKDEYSNNNYHFAPLPPLQHEHRNDLPLRERTRLRRSRSMNDNHNSHRNWFVQWGLSINSWLLGAFRWTTGTSSNMSAAGTLPVPPNTIKSTDTEQLPPECHRDSWQSYNYPTCNDIYEIDLPRMIRLAPRKSYHDTGRFYQDRGASYSNGTTMNAIINNKNIKMGYVAQGYWRSVWAVHPPRRDMTATTTTTLSYHSLNTTTIEPNIVVLKTMRRSHDLSARNYDRHRRDAMVMERLTSSPYVMNIYGFCGNSVLTEYMDLTLEDIAFDESQYPIIETDSGEEIVVTSTKRIQMALDMVRGVQAIHEIHGGPIVHADLQAKQFLISRQTGTVKINDFNRCRFMASKHINRTVSENHQPDATTIVDTIANGSLINTTTTTTTTTTVPCKFRIPSAPGTSRSPEEYMEQELDEKIDVYAVGHVLYNLLSYREAWEGYHTITAQQRMMNREIPNMDVYIPNTNNHHNNLTGPIHALSDLPVPILEWYVNITKRAYIFDPTARASAATLARELEAMLQEIPESG